MDFADQILALAARGLKQVENLETEEATKNALVMPFINALGYNVFDPTEVVPEFVADVGIKKGEKVDYAIMRAGQPIILFECKTASAKLDHVHMSQLFRYFSVTPARIGVCTNGIEYRFYSDLEQTNKMDERPFLEFDLRRPTEPQLAELKKLTKPHFDEEAILEAAGELKYTKEMKRILTRQLSEPDEEVVRYLASQVYSGRLTKGVRDQFEDITRRAFRQFVHDQVQERLQSALDGNAPDSTQGGISTALEVETPAPADDDGIITTPEEMEGFYIIRGILREVVEGSRIAYRDVRTYFGILLDDNNRKPLARLHLNTSQWYLGLFDNPEKQEERLPIESLDEIYDHSERLRTTPSFYE